MPPMRPMSPMHLSDQMGRLNFDAEKFRPGGNQNPNSPPPLYEGYTFVKADAFFPGQKVTWNRVERNKIHLNQYELFKLVQKRAKKSYVSQQYQALSKLKRTHVDQLIDDHRRMDPRAEWYCVYIKEDEKPVKGPGSRPGDYETVSLDIIIMKKPPSFVNPRKSSPDLMDFGSPFKNKGRSVTFDGPFPEPEFRQGNKGVDNNFQWPKQNSQPGQFHPGMGPPQPPQFHQQHSPPGQAQMGGPPMFQGAGPGPGPRPSMPPGPMPSPGIRGPPNADRSSDPGFEILGGPKESPPGPHGHPGPKPDQFPPFGPGQSQHFQKPKHPSVKFSHEHMRKSPEVLSPHELEWGPESSSVEDDESMLFDRDYDSSATEDTDTDIHESFQPRRGSLYRRHSFMKQARHEPIYRSHYRQQPPSKYTLDKKPTHRRYQSGYIDLEPASSRTVTKRPARGSSMELAMYGARGRPKIIHDHATALLDPEYLYEELRGGRTRNDIRTRILDDREARLEHREKLIDLQSRVLDERLDEARILQRRMSSREPYFHAFR